MDIDDLILQRIVAIAGLCLWGLFPLGLFLSVMQQDRDALPPKQLPKKFEDYQMHPPLYEDPFKQVKIGTEKEFEEPKMDDFSHDHISISPGPDHKHTEV